MDLKQNDINNCKFCSIINSQSLTKLSDKILYEGKYFFIIPALGCFIKDYIMIVSKRHIYSMTSLNKHEKIELNELILKFKRIFKKKYGFYPLIFEHGSSELKIDISSASIYHAHMHIVPYQMNTNMIIKELDLIEINDLKDLYKNGNNNNYLFLINNEGQIYFKSYSKQLFGSQIIRRYIATDIGISDKWNWREYPFEENIHDTVQNFKEYITNDFNFSDYRLKYVYYCRAMDGLNTEEIEYEYKKIQFELEKQGRILVNPFDKDEHNKLKLNKSNAEFIVTSNIEGIQKADCVIVDISLKNHLYVGCIGEMIFAKQNNKFVIIISGETGIENHFYSLYCADKIIKSQEILFKTLDWRKL